MKKLVFLLILIVLTVLFTVSCEGGAEITSTKAIDTTAEVPESTLATASLTTTKAPAPETTAPMTTTAFLPETTEAPITYTTKSWMGALPDATQLNQLAMPGTHDSGATVDVLSGTTKCQDATIAEQLAMGVRFFDIRLRRVDGELQVYHGYIDQNLTFDDLLTACYAFLAENPSEALIMCIKEEYDASGTNDSFASMVASKIGEQMGYWHTDPAIPTLGAVRGKIVLMRRYGGVANFGINASSGWSDNTTFTLNAGTCVLSVQDYYQNSSGDAKWSSVSAMFRKMKSQKNIYYLNFTSGYHSDNRYGLELPNILTIKDTVNPKLVEYLKTSPDFVGIVIVDYITAEIAELIYQVNFK